MKSISFILESISIYEFALLYIILIGIVYLYYIQLKYWLNNSNKLTVNLVQNEYRSLRLTIKNQLIDYFQQSRDLIYYYRSETLKYPIYINYCIGALNLNLNSNQNIVEKEYLINNDLKSNTIDLILTFFDNTTSLLNNTSTNISDKINQLKHDIDICSKRESIIIKIINDNTNIHCVSNNTLIEADLGKIGSALSLVKLLTSCSDNIINNLNRIGDNNNLINKQLFKLPLSEILELSNNYARTVYENVIDIFNKIIVNINSLIDRNMKYISKLKYINNLNYFKLKNDIPANTIIDFVEAVINNNKVYFNISYTINPNYYIINYDNQYTLYISSNDIKTIINLDNIQYIFDINNKDNISNTLIKEPAICIYNREDGIFELVKKGILNNS